MSRKVEKEPGCQRCLQKGHWSFECPNPPAYVYRPSARLQYFDPTLKMSLKESPPDSPRGLRKPKVIKKVEAVSLAEKISAEKTDEKICEKAAEESKDKTDEKVDKLSKDAPLRRRSRSRSSSSRSSRSISSSS